jgi:hypothetical protein
MLFVLCSVRQLFYQSQMLKLKKLLKSFKPLFLSVFLSLGTHIYRLLCTLVISECYFGRNIFEHYCKEILNGDMSYDTEVTDLGALQLNIE